MSEIRHEGKASPPQAQPQESGVSALCRRRALLLSALAAAFVPATGASAAVRVRVECGALAPLVQELTELLPLAADCDVGTRAQLVELFEAGRHFVDIVHRDRFLADGTRERLVLCQPSDRLLLCVAALRALRRDGDVVHQAHIESSEGRVAAPMVDGRALDHNPGRGHSLQGAA